MAYELFRTMHEFSVYAFHEKETMLSYISRQTKIPADELKTIILEKALAVLLNGESIEKSRLEEIFVSEKDKITVLPNIAGG